MPARPTPREQPGPRRVLGNLFGSARRTEILVLLNLLEESYPSELARLLDADLSAVRQILDDLERAGVTVTRPLGRTRRVQLNPRYFAAGELGQLLTRLAEGAPELHRIASSRRSRPRRPTKDRARRRSRE